jgi:hypothetical protein
MAAPSGPEPSEGHRHRLLHLHGGWKDIIFLVATGCHFGERPNENLDYSHTFEPLGEVEPRRAREVWHSCHCHQ